jgi:hypothetical protein
VVTNGFWTEEGVTNTAELVANVKLFSDVVTVPTGPAAPEPSTWAMGLIGFAGPVSQSQCLSETPRTTF